MGRSILFSYIPFLGMFPLGRKPLTARDNALIDVLTPEMAKKEYNDLN